MKKFFLMFAISLISMSVFAQFTVEKATDQSCIVKFSLPASRWEEDETSFCFVEQANYMELYNQHKIPFFKTAIILPQDGDFSLTTTKETESRKLKAPYRKNQDETAKGRRIELPQGFYALEDPIVLAGRRILPITIYPLQIMPTNHEATLVKQITFSVAFEKRPEESPHQHPLNSVLQQNTCNYEQGKNWFVQDFGPLRNTESAFEKSQFWYKITIEKNGIYSLSYSDLQNAGVPVATLDPNSFRIFTGEGKAISPDINSTIPEFAEIPIYLQLQNANSFQAGDQILFYAEGNYGFEKNEEYLLTNGYKQLYYSPYDRHNYYWLTFGGSFEAPPQRASTVNAAPSNTTFQQTALETIHAEEEKRPPEVSEHIGVHALFPWYGQEYSLYPNIPYGVTLSLPNLDSTQPQTMRFRSQLRSESGFLNLNFLFPTPFTGTVWSENIITHEGLLFNSENTSLQFQSTASRTYDLWLDYVEIDYYQKLQAINGYLSFASQQTASYQAKGFSENALIFETENQHHLAVVTNVNYNTDQQALQFDGQENHQYFLGESNSFLTPIQIKEKTTAHLRQLSAADYVIIAPHAMANSSALQQLAAHRQSHNHFVVELVDLEDVFDEFTWGLRDPMAIRFFLKYLWQKSNYRLSYALLVGDGTFDPQNRTGSAAAYNWMPIMPYTANLGVPKDDGFVHFTTTSFPQLALGRFPVIKDSEIQACVNKILHYELDSPFGSWRTRMLLVPDDAFYNNAYNGGEWGMHPEAAYRYSLNMPAHIDICEIFTHEYPFYFGQKTYVAEDILEEINRGTILFYYLGHGSQNSMTSEAVFRSFADVPRMDNYDRMCVVFSASCDNGAFAETNMRCITEDMFLKSDGGAIATLASTFHSAGDSNTALMQSISLALFDPGTEPILGNAIISGKTNSGNAANSSRYALFGDPALRVNLPHHYYTESTIPETIQRQQLVSVNWDEQIFQAKEYEIKGMEPWYELNYHFPTSDPESNNYPYYKRGNTFCRNTFTQADSIGFIMPYDAQIGDDALFFVYAHNDTTDWIAAMDDLEVEGVAYAENADDPQIEIGFENKNFVSGDYIPPNAEMDIRISDPNGINIMGKTGHKIVLALDGDYENAEDLTSSFEYDENSLTSGTVSYSLSGLSSGNHTAELIAFDNFNRGAKDTLSFYTEESFSDANLRLENVLNYPNPCETETYFTFLLSLNAQVKIKIFTITGISIQTLELDGQAGYNQFPWNLHDQDGDRIGSGIYYYVVQAQAENAEGKPLKVSKTEKLVVKK